MGEYIEDPQNTIGDELLAIRCQLGEAAAFDTLIARWHPPLWKYIRRMSGNDDDAAEVLQDTWLRVLRAMPRLRDPARLRAWLFGIARRAVMDRLREHYGRGPTEGAAARGPGPGPEFDVPVSSASTDAAQSADADALDDAIDLMRDELARLPLIEREVLVLFYLQELSLAQVADVLGVPVGTVKSRLFRARLMLRQRLTERGSNHE